VVVEGASQRTAASGGDRGSATEPPFSGQARPADGEDRAINHLAAAAPSGGWTPVPETFVAADAQRSLLRSAATGVPVRRRVHGASEADGPMRDRRIEFYGGGIDANTARRPKSARRRLYTWREARRWNRPTQRTH
jgi:hypothetical protein